MTAGDVITTKSGNELEIIKIMKHILICRLINWVDTSTATNPSTDIRIIRKSNVVFIQGKLF